MIVNPRKNSVFFPRIWRGFGQESNDQPNTSSNTTEPEHHFFRERISSISGIFSNARNKFRINENQTVLDNLDGEIVKEDSYLYSTRPSIDSINLHNYFKIETQEQGQTDNEADNENRNSLECSDRTKKCFRGLLLTIIISNLWAGSLHLIKICYLEGQSDHRFNNSYFNRNLLFQQENNDINQNQIDVKMYDYVVKLESNALKMNKSILNSLNLNKFKSRNQSTESSSNNNQTFKISPFYKQMTSSLKNNPNKTKFNAPFFMAWYISMFNILFLPLFTFFKMCFFNQKENVTMKKIFLESIHHFIDRGFTTIQFFSRCGLFCALWTLANYLLIYTIRKLDTTVSMALFACSVNLVYILSWVVLHQQFVGIRIVAVIISNTGIALLAYMNHVDRTTVFNVVLGTGAACCVAIYKVFYKRIIGYTTFAQTSLFFTLVGFLNGFLLWPIMILLYFAGAEILSVNSIPWLYLTGSAILNLFANFLGNFGLVWTYEVFLTLGMLFSIPMSSLIDSYFYNVIFQGKKLSGIILIGVGFLIVLLPDNWNEYLAKILRSRLTKWKRKEQQKKNVQKVQDTTTAHLSRLRTPSGRVK